MLDTDGLYNKTFTAVVHYVPQQASVSVTVIYSHPSIITVGKAGTYPYRTPLGTLACKHWTRVEVTNALTYYSTKAITVVKGLFA
jgi:hypothetical protein